MKKILIFGGLGVLGFEIIQHLKKLKLDYLEIKTDIKLIAIMLMELPMIF